MTKNKIRNNMDVYLGNLDKKIHIFFIWERAKNAWNSAFQWDKKNLKNRNSVTFSTKFQDFTNIHKIK